MGHAGAIVSGSAGTAQAKKEALEAAGVRVGKTPSETAALMREIVAGLYPGRENDEETILFWHRGLSLSDIALGHAMLEKGRRLGIGQRLRFG